MRIVFEIKEKLSDIANEILQSPRWNTEITEQISGKTVAIIRDKEYDSQATAEIYEHSISIKTAWSKYTYYIYERDGKTWCEYNGAYRGLLEQKLLPTIEPRESLLDSEVLESTLYKRERKSLREYAIENEKHKKERQEYYHEGQQNNDTPPHPKRVYDEFIKEDYIGPQL